MDKKEREKRELEELLILELCDCGPGRYSINHEQDGSINIEPVVDTDTKKEK